MIKMRVKSILMRVISSRTGKHAAKIKSKSMEILFKPGKTELSQRFGFLRAAPLPPFGLQSFF